jgi:hypothetical protein
MIPQYEGIRIFWRASILVSIARLSARLWNIHKVSINHRLIHSYCLLKRSRLLFSWMFIRNVILLGLSYPPPFHYKRGLSGFLRYLQSFRCIYSRILRLSDTFIISECIWQIIYNILQIYYFLNLQFNFFIHGSEDRMNLSSQFISWHSKWYL